MDVGYYYQVLDTGILYEKGRKKGKLWGIGEKRRLRAEVIFWNNILKFISNERDGIDCSKELFECLGEMCRKYRLPNYERILANKEEIENDKTLFKRDVKEEIKICGFMERLLVDMQRYLDDYKNKKMVYRIMEVLHNLPKAMHGQNILNNSCNLISYTDALSYAKGYMNDSMKKEYEKFLL